MTEHRTSSTPTSPAFPAPTARAFTSPAASAPAPASSPASSPGRPQTRLDAGNRVGLVLAGLLALGDLLGAFFLDHAFDPSQPGPPPAVLWFDFAVSFVTLTGVALAWVGVWRRPAVRLAAASRVLSAITALPAFFVGGVPAGLVVLAASGVLLTVVAVGLMMRRPRGGA